MGGLVLKLRQWWDTADRTQRTVSVGGGAFLVLMIALTFMFASRPHMAMLFGGLTAADQGSVAAEIQKMGVNAEFDERGNIMVPSDKIAEVRMKLAAAGKLPTTSGFGDAALEKLGIMDTPAVEKERLKTILEGRLTENIESIDGIGSAQVHIVLANDSAFINDKKPATASVTVSERAGSSITKDQAKAIATLVANSTPELSLNNVSVINNRMELLWDGRALDSNGGEVSDKIQAETAEAKRREADIQAMLDPVFGPGAAIAKVNLELDFDGKSVTSDTYNPQSKASAVQTETMQPGASALNVGQPAAPESKAGGQNYNRTDKQFTVLADSTHVEQKQTGGALKSMSIDVIVDSAKIKDPQPVKDIIDGYLGSKSGKDGFTSKITSVAFDTQAATDAKKAADAVGGQQRMQQIISLLPVAALLIVGFLVMKSVGKFSKTPTLALAGGGTASLPISMGQSALPASTADAIRLAAERPNDVNVQQLTRQMTEAGMSEDEAEAQLAAIKGISRKVNVPLEQIKKMSSDRPETVAMLIKGWLLEER